MKIRTLFISDIHLGTSKSQPDKLLEVLKNYEFDRLIIIGDFIDLTAMKRKIYWNQDHSTVIQKILRLSRKNVHVDYILGNHDYYLRSLLQDGSISIGNINVCDYLYYETLLGEKIYICHGDQFDGFIRIHPFLYMLGDIAYELSYKINTVYNAIRNLLGFQYWSLSKYLKTKVKNAVSFINDFKFLSLKTIKEKQCDAIMIGHIHHPSIEHIEDKKYYNTGDFCETCSFLYEDEQGIIHLMMMDP